MHGTQHIILGGKTVIQADVCIRGDLYRQQSSSSSSSLSSTSNTPDGDSNTKENSSGGGRGGGSSVAVSVGRYTYLSRGCLLRPPSRLHRGVHSFFPLKMGDHVFVGEHTVVEAASVGSHVHIGRDAVVGSMAILKDFVLVLDGAVVPAGMVAPSFCVVGGAPARVVGEIGEGFGVEGAEGGMARERYRAVGR